MKLRLVRDVLGKDFTLGQLFIDGVWECFTLEDKVREVKGRPVSEWKIPALTAIPAGRYQVVITFSQRFQKHLPLLLDVPGFSGIRIHPLNKSTETEGCLGVGTKRDLSGLILNSRAAMNKLQPKIEAAIMGGGKVFIEII